MITLPTHVARMILFDKIHPVVAWRNYFNISQHEVANFIGVSLCEIEKIENSNLHLHPDYLPKLTHLFGIKPDAIKIKYLHQTYSLINIRE